MLTLTERQRLIRRAAAEFARRELAPDAAMRDRERRFPAEAFAGRAKFATVIAASRPEEGRDRIKRIEAVEECVEKQRRGFVEPSSRFANPPMRSAPSSPTSAGVVQPHSLMLAAMAAT